MSIELRVANALSLAWADHESGGRSAENSLPQEVEAAVNAVLENGSAPNRQLLLTLAAGAAEEPTRNAASLQLAAGVDRRTQAKEVRKALSKFRADHGLTLKISQDAGVSNQFREPEINQAWVDGRKKHDRGWATGFFTVVTWLNASEGAARAACAEQLLQFTAGCVVEIAVESALDYPRFQATPRLAMALVRQFIDAAPDKPDATEAIVAVAARSFANALGSKPSVERRDINSPDPIDVLIIASDGSVRSGIEVTDEQISLGKLEHEVVPAMLKLGLDRATVVSRGVKPAEKSAVEDYVNRVFKHFQQRIDLETVDVIESWLSFPGASRTLATDFLWGVGVELDSYSRNENRRAWFEILSNYAASISEV